MLLIKVSDNHEFELSVCYVFILKCSTSCKLIFHQQVRTWMKSVSWIHLHSTTCHLCHIITVITFLNYTVTHCNFPHTNSVLHHCSHVAFIFLTERCFQIYHITPITALILIKKMRRSWCFNPVCWTCCVKITPGIPYNQRNLYVLYKLLQIG